MSNMLEKLNALLSDPVALERIRKERLKKEEFRSRWVKKIISILEETHNLDSLYERFTKHQNKREELLYKKHIIGETSLLSPLLEAFKEIGEPYEDSVDTSFLDYAFTYKGYVMELIQGQGSIIRIYKI